MSHSWITNGLDADPSEDPVERDVDPDRPRVETPLTDFNELAKFSCDEGILINMGGVRGGKFL